MHTQLPQLVVIHGGESHANRERYLAWLRTLNITEESLRPERKWKDTLDHELHGVASVLRPSMPSALNATYEEWSIYFDRIVPLLRDGCILLGHSLGGVFLVKYLSEHNLPVHIRALILLAAPYGDANGYTLADFNLENVPTARCGTQASLIYILHSTDDPVVPFADMESYARVFPEARQITFADKQHFNQPEFPEIVALIKEITASAAK